MRILLTVLTIVLAVGSVLTGALSAFFGAASIAYMTACESNGDGPALDSTCTTSGPYIHQPLLVIAIVIGVISFGLLAAAIVIAVRQHRDRRAAFAPIHTTPEPADAS